MTGLVAVLVYQTKAVLHVVELNWVLKENIHKYAFYILEYEEHRYYYSIN